MCQFYVICEYTPTALLVGGGLPRSTCSGELAGEPLDGFGWGGGGNRFVEHLAALGLFETLQLLDLLLDLLLGRLNSLDDGFHR